MVHRWFEPLGRCWQLLLVKQLLSYALALEMKSLTAIASGLTFVEDKMMEKGITAKAKSLKE